MKLTRRIKLLIVWAVALIGTGCLVWSGSGSIQYGIATTLGLLAVSIGVPLMRAFTEFSK